MPYNTKSVKKDTDSKPIPQIFDPTVDDFAVLEGFDGATYFHQKGTMIIDFIEGEGAGTTQTITFTESVRGLYLKNISLESLTFSVNGKIATLDPDEAFQGLFRDPFTSIDITANGKYKGHINE